MAQVAVDLNDVTKRFDATVVVDNLNLEIEDGEFFSLLGSSGSGKTTTLRMIAGLEIPPTATSGYMASKWRRSQRISARSTLCFRAMRSFPT